MLAGDGIERSSILTGLTSPERIGILSCWWSGLGTGGSTSRTERGMAGTGSLSGMRRRSSIGTAAAIEDSVLIIYVLECVAAIFVVCVE